MAKLETPKEIISVTHFINPHLFWYHKVDVSNDEYHEILKVEKELADYYKDRQVWIQRLRRPTINSIVAVKFLAWNKMIRARVDHIAGFGKSVPGGEFIMWAIDYGFPFQTKLDHIYRLPNKFTRPVNYIHCGGLSKILPAEMLFMHNEMIIEVSSKWHQRACDVVEQILNGSECIVFAKEYTLNEQDWGELIIKTNKGIKVNVKDHLMSLHLAGNAKNNFHLECQKLKTTKISPWLCNNGSSKFQINQAYIYHHIRKKTNNGNQTLKIECDDKAKQKVEEWYEQNQFTPGQKTGFLDTTTKCTITDRPLLGSIWNIKDKQEDNFKRMNENKKSKLVQLAGIKKYEWRKFSAPPLPDCGNFKMEVNEIKTIRNVDRIDSGMSSIKYLHSHNSTINTFYSTAKLGNQQRNNVCMPKTDFKGNVGIISTPTEDNVNNGTLAEHLINLRKQYIDRKANKNVSPEPESACTVEEPHSREFDLSKPTKGTTNYKPKISDLSSTFHGLRMIPAGYDIKNLNDYNNHEHWHCKKSTLNDLIPHNKRDLLDYDN